MSKYREAIARLVEEAKRTSPKGVIETSSVRLRMIARLHRVSVLKVGDDFLAAAKKAAKTRR
jgi:hypothetical protein